MRSTRKEETVAEQIGDPPSDGDWIRILEAECDQLLQDRRELLEAVDGHEAQSNYFCNKCGGFFLESQGRLAVPGNPIRGLIHDGCNYLAGRSVPDEDLYAVAKQIRERMEEP
jgi:hypothetical protein